MKITAYNAYTAAKAVATQNTTSKKGPIVARALNLAHDPDLKTAKNGDVYAVLNGYDKNDKLYKVLAFGKAAQEIVDSLTKGDYVEFTGRQEEIPSSFNAKAEAAIRINAGDGSFRVLYASQQKAEAKAARGLQAKANFVEESEAEDLPF